MIYFDEDMNAYGFKIDNYIASTTDAIWEKHCLDNDSWTIKDGKFTDLTNTSDYKSKLAQKERERLDQLTLTAADVERAIYKDKGINFDDIAEIIEELNEAGTANIDIKVLKIELKANNFYRGNDFVNQIGTIVGYSSEDLDYLFENKTLPSGGE